MIISILQPGYLPWLGFFEQMWKSDIFVLYDDVQYDKNGWRNRNRIKTSQGVQWLSVPVHVKLGDLIKDVLIDNGTNWKRKHLSAISQAYINAQYYEDIYPHIENALTREWKYLLDLDAFLIGELNKLLGIERRLLLSSELNIIEGGKTGRLVNICKHFGANVFYEGQKGKEYIDDADFRNEGIKIEYQDYKHPIYTQLHGDYVSHLSIIDLLFNHGPDSLIMLTGTKVINAEV